jgi:hypothetical protein
MLAVSKKFLLSWVEGIEDSGALRQAGRQAELRPEAAIGGMPCDPDCLRRGLKPGCHLLVLIALRIPREDMTLAGRHQRQHSRDVLRGARRAVGVESMLLREDR